jgi:hypothetical protein
MTSADPQRQAENWLQQEEPKVEQSGSGSEDDAQDGDRDVLQSIKEAYRDRS